MPDFVRVTPREGALVRNPTTFARIPSEGAVVELSSHWVRQELAGDVALEPVHIESGDEAPPVVDPAVEAALDEFAEEGA